MESLNVLVIGGVVPWVPYTGGGYIIPYKLSESIAHQGHNIDYIAIATENFRREIDWGNFMYFDKNSLVSQFFRSFKDIKKDYDVIHIHEGHKTVGYGLGRGIRHKILRKFDNSKICLSIYAPKVHKVPRSFDEICWKFSSKGVDLILTLSEFSKENVSTAYAIPKSKIRVTYAGVEDIFFINKQPKQGINFTLLFVGRLNGFREQKGVDVLLKAMPLILKEYDVALQIIGTGSRANEYKELAKDLEVDEHVEFLGPIEHEKLPGHYANADLFVFPSRRESFGLVLAEAMAAGLPVVSTSVGAIPEVIKDGETGLLAPPNNPQKFAEAVDFLLNNPERMRMMGEKGKKRVRGFFTWDEVAKNVIKFYEELL